MPKKQISLLEDVRARLTDIRGKIKERVEEIKGKVAPGAAQREPLFPRVKEFREKAREKGFLTELKARREKRLQKMRGELGREPEEIEPAYPKARAVKEEAEITPTVGKREIAIEV